MPVIFYKVGCCIGGEKIETYIFRKQIRHSIIMSSRNREEGRLGSIILLAAAGGLSFVAAWNEQSYWQNEVNRPDRVITKENIFEIKKGIYCLQGVEPDSFMKIKEQRKIETKVIDNTQKGKTRGFQQVENNDKRLEFVKSLTLFRHPVVEGSGLNFSNFRPLFPSGFFNDTTYGNTKVIFDFMKLKGFPATGLKPEFSGKFLAESGGLSPMEKVYMYVNTNSYGSKKIECMSDSKERIARYKDNSAISYSFAVMCGIGAAIIALI